MIATVSGGCSRLGFAVGPSGEAPRVDLAPRDAPGARETIAPDLARDLRRNRDSSAAKDTSKVADAGFATITPKELTTGGDSALSSSYVTASISPSANRLVLAWIATTPDTIPQLSGNNLIWTSVATVSYGTISPGRIALFRATGTSPTPGPLTITFPGAQTGCAWVIQQLEGVELAGAGEPSAIVQELSAQASTASSLTITLGKPMASPASASVGGFASQSDSTTSPAILPGAGYTGSTTALYAFPYLSLRVEWKLPGSTTVDVALTSPAHIGGIALELAAQRL